MSEIEETSKAIAETAKFGTKALDTGDKLGGFLSKVLGYPTEEAIGIVGDALKYKRWQRQVRMIDKVNDDLEKRGVESVRPIPPKLAIPMIENASLEEDDDLQDIWCRLIANSLDPSFRLDIRYAYIEVIKSLSSLDARILSMLYKNSQQPFLRSKHLFTDEIFKRVLRLKYTGMDYDISLLNLQRLMCIEHVLVKRAYADATQEIRDHRQYSLTIFGMFFVKTCME